MRVHICVVIVLALTGQIAATSRSLTREQQLSKLRLDERLMQLEQSKTSLQTQKEELETITELYKGGYVALQTFQLTDINYQKARLEFEAAEIELEETKLDLLRNATHITVVEARKYKTDDGRGMVDIRLENSSDIRDALLVDASLSEKELRTLLTVENMGVALFLRRPSLGCGLLEVPVPESIPSFRLNVDS